jgi:hypothetical protein
MEDARDGGKSPAQGQARESEQKRLPSLWTFGIVPAEQVKLDPRKPMEMHYELEGQRVRSFNFLSFNFLDSIARAHGRITRTELLDVVKDPKTLVIFRVRIVHEKWGPLARAVLAALEQTMRKRSAICHLG